ncbi:MAG: phosphatidylglycerophosphatase A [Oligoflexia bacterium]|nr:phosphatidylglycerophosphatase A [Oligoflexia bacterium]
MHRFIATGCYSGLLPGAPGTWGSLACLCAWLALSFSSPIYSAFLAVFVIVLGILSTRAYLTQTPELGQDPACVVVDEWAGMLITLLPLNSNAPYWQPVLAFALFRTFDIIKPWPVGRMERLPGAWGIMLDDVVAGIIAAAILLMVVKPGLIHF